MKGMSKVLAKLCTVLLCLLFLIIPASAVIVSIDPASQSSTVGSAYYIGVDVDSEGENVQFIHVEVTYPAAYTEALSITYNNLMGGYVAVEPGSGISSGKVTYGISLTSGNATPVSGTFITIQMYGASNSSGPFDINLTNIDIMNTSVNHLDASTFSLINGSGNIGAGVSSTPSESIVSTVYSPIHQVRFIVASLNGTRYPGLSVTSTESTGDVLTGTTQGDGAVVFTMNSSHNYTVTFVNVAQGINLTWTGYPISSDYFVYRSGNGSFATIGIINTTLTNYTPIYTTQNFSIQNVTGAYLTSTIGLGPMGQGTLVGIVAWVVVGAGGLFAVLGTMAVMALLEIITWTMALFIAMTAVALFVLLGGIGQSW